MRGLRFVFRVSFSGVLWVGLAAVFHSALYHHPLRIHFENCSRTNISPDADHKTYSIILKNDVPDDKTESRERSTISYEYHFSHHNKQPATVLARFEDFTPFYRGRLARDAPPLDLKNVKRLSIMCRSFFGRLEQEGEFRIEFKGFDTYRAKKGKGKENAEGRENVEGKGKEVLIDVDRKKVDPQVGEENKKDSEEDWEMVGSNDAANAKPEEADKNGWTCSVM
jgi:hypothetical protein